MGFFMGSVAVMYVNTSTRSFQILPNTRNLTYGITRALIGTPIGGSLVANHGYFTTSMFCGATLVAGGLLMVISRLKLNKKLLSAV
jgi:hypothetical protein